MQTKNKLDVGIMGPIGECITFIVDEILITEVITRSLVSMTGIETLLNIGRIELKRHGKIKEMSKMDQLISMAKSTAKQAIKLEQDDFNVINIHCVVAIWGALEACVENMITLILMNDRGAINTLRQSGATVRSIPGAPADEDCFKIYKNLERELRKSKSVAEAYVEMLGIFGINVDCDNGMATKMAEINEIRNALLHRAGRINQRSITNAPALKPYLNRKIAIGAAVCGKYQKVVSDFCRNILDGISTSNYI
jgi:hypothetical protein